MDPYKLLSRSTRLSKHGASQHRSTPSSGPSAQPQLFPLTSEPSKPTGHTSRKRKRTQQTQESADLDFFGDSSSNVRKNVPAGSIDEEDAAIAATEVAPLVSSMSSEDCKHILHKHKLKATWINPPTPIKKQRRKSGEKKKSKVEKAEKLPIFPQPLQAFAELRTRYSFSGRLATNIDDQGYAIPTEVQLGALPILLDQAENFLPKASSSPASPTTSQVDLLTVAPTGSGKTLAFMIPVLHNINTTRRDLPQGSKHTFAIILAPTKELAGQIANEGRKLAKDTGIKVTQVRKGMKLPKSSNKDDESELAVESGTNEIVVKSDILVSTPGTLATIVKEAQEHDGEVLSDVRYLVMDEADVLLDPLFREQSLAIWNALLRPDLRVSLWSATMGSNIEELARTVINERRMRISASLAGECVEAPLIRLVVGLKDSAVPNIQHRLVYAASEQGKLMGLRQLLHPTTTTAESGPPLLPPFLVFTQTIERAVALHSELLYDIPPEAGGISRIAVLHSDLSDTARDSVMTKFRKGEIWVLITTDLLSRGVDFRGVNGVVNYDIPTSSAAYVHRVGRTGRAGREGGVAVTLYSKDDIPYLKNVANVVAMAQKQNADSESSKEGVQQWLLDALPNLTKQAKKDLRKHGIQSRTAKGMKDDPKAARRSRISTKSGFERREENKKKGAIRGSRQRQKAATIDAGEETHFGGFD
ncbi:uncharacterized protein MYCGRDRAFT_65543 [Zymoseptoria tritici IPO323]|uniref:ATP-dependent RNA helicase n=1 Tax=Zymoseptoria tritici (strain CBS 115943 / IPO323) TaxID=336722 RepID=F9WWC2_ZYMTI|nr:uncharacterized protein MYCGRDRAFT_65543 [Zymoseptoria tritici IPO323]EGP92532.1 hypothetical protein MYCGRDRAFT_65543 [Zymoseptoria tritici IPO323]